MDRETKEVLIQQNVGLVILMAKKYSNTGVDLEELISVGNLGLVKAVVAFKPEKNRKFSTYACRCIENEILMHLRKIRKRRNNEISENAPIRVGTQGLLIHISDLLATEPDLVTRKLETQEEKTLLQTAMGMLPEREQTLIRLRYGIGYRNGLKQQAVAERLGISQSYVSKLEKRSLNSLRCKILKIAKGS